MYSPGRLCICNLCTKSVLIFHQKSGLVAVECFRFYIYHSGVFHNLYQSVGSIVIGAFAKSRKCLLASLCLSVRPPVHTYQFDSHWTFGVSLFIIVTSSSVNMNNLKTEFVQLCYLLGCRPSCAIVGMDVILCLTSNYLPPPFFLFGPCCGSGG